MPRHRPPRPPRPHRPNAIPLPEAHILLTSFNTFLIVAIHNILYYRAIYPPGTFLTAKAFNLPVHQSRHPRLCAWIKDAVDAVATQLAQGGVERVAVTIHAPATGINVPPERSKTEDESQPGSVDFVPSISSNQTTSATTNPSSLTRIPPNAVLERWIFDVSHYPAWPGGAAAMRDYGSKQKPGAEEANQSGQGKGKAREELNWVDVNETLRGVIRRMVGVAEGMDALPEGCAFTVAIELKEEGRAPIGV
jgi:mitotic spindle assembly checkpoint protein MAD2B